METTNLNNAKVKKIGDVLEFIAGAVKREEIVAASGQSIRMAVMKVFCTVCGEDWKNVLVEKVVLEDVLDRYGQLEKGKRSSETIRTNKSKVRRAFRMLGLAEETVEQETLKGTVEYEYYTISLENNRAAKLTIPRDLSEEELARVEKSVKDIFMVEGFKRKGGV